MADVVLLSTFNALSQPEVHKSLGCIMASKVSFATPSGDGQRDKGRLRVLHHVCQRTTPQSAPTGFFLQVIITLRQSSSGLTITTRQRCVAVDDHQPVYLPSLRSNIHTETFTRQRYERGEQGRDSCRPMSQMIRSLLTVLFKAKSMLQAS